MMIPSSWQSRQTTVPVYNNFVGTNSPDEFAELDGSRTITIDWRHILPQSTWAHPCLLSTHLASGRRAAVATHLIILQAFIDNEPEPEEAYYSLLLFLWAVGKGLVQPRTIYDPPQSHAINDKLVEINHKLKQPLEQLPSNGEPKQNSPRAIGRPAGREQRPSQATHSRSGTIPKSG
jgi:hypothetical protein